MPDRPSISVIVPALEAAKVLPDCLAALAASEVRPDEVIVVDDGGSADGTAGVARSLGATVLVLPRRLGPGGARNAGVAASRGEILVFVDADVTVRPGAIGFLLRAFENQPDVAAAFGSYDVTPPRANLASQYKNLLHHFVHQGAREEARTFWAGLGAVRRPAFEAAGGFDAARYDRPSIEDIELGDRLHAGGHRLVLVKEAQGSHLKRWTVASVFRTDLFHRALPWTELILLSGRMPDDLNLGLRHKMGVAATGAGLLFALLSFADVRFLGAAAAAWGVALVAAGDVLTFFARERGVLFAFRAAPLHLAYYLASGLGFVLGLGHHLLRRTT